MKKHAVKKKNVNTSLENHKIHYLSQYKCIILHVTTNIKETSGLMNSKIHVFV